MGPAPTPEFNERYAFEREQRAEQAEGSAGGFGADAGVVEGKPALFHESQHSPPPFQAGMQHQQHQQTGQLPSAAYYGATHAAPQPFPGVAIRGPQHAPPHGHGITGYQIVHPQGCCSCDLKTNGWLVVSILLVLFPCVACIPCCLDDCFQTYQVPVYGPPGSAPPSVPIAFPVNK